MPILFYLVTGFLGSGKTTLLKHILERHADRQKIAIVQNEFAPANIDGSTLKESGKPFEIMEINKGSVFCVCLLSGFIESLSTFVDTHQPDAVFLEASGLADPIAIIEMMQSPVLNQKIKLQHIWCIVDACNYLKLNATNQRIKHQVMIADRIILNKTDLNHPNIHLLTNNIQKDNPFATITSSSFCQINVDNIFHYDLQPVAQRRKAEYQEIASSSRPETGIAVLKTTQKLPAKEVSPFLESTTKNTIRAKGYIKNQENETLAVQSSFGYIQTQVITNYPGPTELIYIGNNVQVSTINKTFKNHLQSS